MRNQSEDPFIVGAAIGVEDSALRELIDQIEAQHDFWRAIGSPGDNLLMVAELATQIERLLDDERDWRRLGYFLERARWGREDEPMDLLRVLEVLELLPAAARAAHRARKPHRQSLPFWIADAATRVLTFCKERKLAFSGQLSRKQQSTWPIGNPGLRLLLAVVGRVDPSARRKCFTAAKRAAAQQKKGR